MDDITWKTGYQWKKFDFKIQSESFGSLTFLRKPTSNANFKTNSEEIQFTQSSFWSNKVIVSRNGQLIAEMSYAHLFKTALKLTDGKVFKLTINPYSREFRWVDAGDTPVVEFKQTLKISRGSVRFIETITQQENEVLISGGIVGFMYNSYRLNFLILGMVVIAVVAIIASTIK